MGNRNAPDVRIEIGVGVLNLTELLDARHHQCRLAIRHERLDKAPTRAYHGTFVALVVAGLLGALVASVIWAAITPGGIDR